MLRPRKAGSNAVYLGGYIGELLGTQFEGCAVLVGYLLNRLVANERCILKGQEKAKVPLVMH